jgi:hypothetical protein
VRKYFSFTDELLGGQLATCVIVIQFLGYFSLDIVATKRRRRVLNSKFRCNYWMEANSSKRMWHYIKIGDDIKSFRCVKPDFLGSIELILSKYGIFFLIFQLLPWRILTAIRVIIFWFIKISDHLAHSTYHIFWQWHNFIDYITF